MQVNVKCLAGYIMAHAKNMNHAILIAKKCSVLKGEGKSVEVR